MKCTNTQQSTNKRKEEYNGETLEKNSRLRPHFLKSKTLKYKNVKYIIGANSKNFASHLFNFVKLLNTTTVIHSAG